MSDNKKDMVPTQQVEVFDPLRAPETYDPYQIDQGFDGPHPDVDAPRDPTKRVYDPRILHQMKRAGLQKPADCTIAQWYGPKRNLNAKQKFIAHLAAQGIPNKQIAKETGFSEVHISRLLNTTRIREYINHLQYKLYGKSAERKFKELLPDAIKTAADIMLKTTVKDHVRLHAAEVIMDRALGKPKQSLEVGGSLIRDLFEQLDKMKEQPKTVEVKVENYEDAVVIEGQPIEDEDDEEFRLSRESKDDIDIFMEKHFSDKK